MEIPHEIDNEQGTTNKNKKEENLSGWIKALCELKSD